jgi:G3E family GTPase
VSRPSPRDRHEESVRQAAVADRIVLTKTDIADEPTAARLVARLKRLNPTAQLVRSADRLDAEALIGQDAQATASAGTSARAWFEETFRADDPTLDEAVSHGHDRLDRNVHLGRIRSFAVVFDVPIDWTAFGIWLSMLLNRHGDRVLRVKGILNIEGETNPVAIHGVQHLVHTPVHMAGWSNDDRRSRIVFIVDGLDPDLVRRSMAAFNRLGQGALQR